MSLSEMNDWNEDYHDDDYSVSNIERKSRLLEKILREEEYKGREMLDRVSKLENEVKYLREQLKSGERYVY